MRAIDVVDVNAVKTNWIGQLIGFTDSRCGEYDVVKSFAEPLPTFIYQPYEKDDKPICKTLSMDAAKQGYADKAFTMQAKVTDAASTDETAALALLTAFKTAAATMRGGLFDFAAVQQQKRQFGKTTTSSCTRLVLSHKKTELQIELLIS